MTQNPDNYAFSLFPSAYAQSSTAAHAGFDYMSLVPFLLLFVVMYFLILRPQQKRTKEHKSMLSALRRGDKVITAGGLIGTINKIITDEEVELEITQGVNVRVVRSMISHVLAKTEPGKPSSTSLEDKETTKKNPFSVIKKTKK